MPCLLLSSGSDKNGEKTMMLYSLPLLPSSRVKHVMKGNQQLVQEVSRIIKLTNVCVF